MTAGKVTSMSPLSVLKDIGLSGVTFSIWVTTAPFREWATTTPETLVRVTDPFRLLASISPSTFSTRILPSFTQPSLSDVALGTWIFKSASQPFGPVPTDTTFSSSSTVSPVMAISIRFRPSPCWLSLFGGFTPRSHASTNTYLPPYPLTVMPHDMRLAFTLGWDLPPQPPPRIRRSQVPGNVNGPERKSKM